MGVQQIALSPGFAVDHTAFAMMRTGELYRTTDSGQTWHALDACVYAAAMSPEFEQDHTLMGVAYAGPDRTELCISRDGGDHWERLADGPAGVTIQMLSLAPQFTKWNVAFAFGSDGTLYRSADGGISWASVLSTGEPSFESPQLVYAPDIEVNRPVFLVTTTTDPSSDPPLVQGSLYRSTDGGTTWQVVQLPEGISPTAVAISPNFIHDGQLFIGTADGRVLVLDASTLAGAPIPSERP